MELNELNRQVQVKLHQYCHKFKEDYSKPDYRFIRQVGNRHLYYRGEKMEEKKISRKVRLSLRFEVLKRRKNRLVKAIFHCGAVPVKFTDR